MSGVHHNRGASQNLRTVMLKSNAVRTKVELRVLQWEVEIMRHANGKQSLREILAPVKARLPPKAVAEAMYLPYQFGVVNLLPPESA